MEGITKSVEAVRYVRVPVSLISQLFVPEYSVYDLMSYCIYEAAMDIFKTMSIANNEAFQKDLIYNFYKRNGALTDELVGCLDDLQDADLISFDECYKGNTTEGEFQPDQEIEDLTDFLAGNEDDRLDFTKDHFLEIANEWCRIRAVLLKFQLSASVEFIINSHHKLQSLVRGKAFAPVGIIFLLDYLNNAKTEKDRVKLALLLGIKSIIGMGKKYAFTTIALIKCRMFGFSSTKELEKALALKKNAKLKGLYEYYTTYRRFEKLRNELVYSRLVMVWTGYGRRTIIATAYDWDNIKIDVANYIRRKQGNTLRYAARQQRNELTQMLKQN